MNALQIVQEYFPNVNQVQDAKQSITVEVTKRDNESAQVRNHKTCAMAVACKRKTHADGVIVSVATMYVVEGKKAIRYKLPERVSREVISFDRNGGFASGEYTANPPSNDQKLGVGRGGNGPKTGKGKKLSRKHLTTGIRTVLGSKLT